jgi:hypothetical protein
MKSLNANQKYSALNIVNAKCENGKPLTYKAHIKDDEKSYTETQSISVGNSRNKLVDGIYRKTSEVVNESAVFKH